MILILHLTIPFSEEADKMVMVRNFEFNQLANTLWSMLFSNRMSQFPLQNLFGPQNQPVSLQNLKYCIGFLTLANELDPFTLYIHKLRLVKASQGFEHETVIVTVMCLGSELQWELAFDRSQSGESQGDASNTFEYPPGPRGDTMQAADSSLQYLKITGHPAEDSVTYLHPYSTLAKRDAISEIHFATPSLSTSGSQVFVLEPYGLEGYIQNKKPLFLNSFINLVELLHQDGGCYNLFSTNCFWMSGTLFRVCAAYFGTSALLEQDLSTAGTYKRIPITDPLLEEKLNIVISKWKIANQEFMDSKVGKLPAQVLCCANFFTYTDCQNV